jgi:hypothetical protein
MNAQLKALSFQSEYIAKSYNFTCSHADLQSLTISPLKTTLKAPRYATAPDASKTSPVMLISFEPFEKIVD